MTWSPNYTPLADSIGLSALVAALPVVTLLALVAFWHVRAQLAPPAGLLVAAAFASRGFLFPFFLPLLDWQGVALTGSDASSNVFLGNLQKVTAQQLDLSPSLTAASTSSGGVMGKVIDARPYVAA